MGKTVNQFDRLRKVGAFIDNYRAHGSLFADSLEEFDESREVVVSLIDEYKACQKEDYIDYGKNDDEDIIDQ